MSQSTEITDVATMLAQSILHEIGRAVDQYGDGKPLETHIAYYIITTALEGAYANILAAMIKPESRMDMIDSFARDMKKFTSQVEDMKKAH